MGQDELARRFVALANVLVDEAVKATDTEAELVLNVAGPRGEQWKCYYYFVDLRNRRLFWLTNVKVGELFEKRFEGVVVHRSQISPLIKLFPFSLPTHAKGIFLSNTIGKFVPRVT